MWWGKCFAPLIPFTPKGSKLEQICGGSRSPSLIHIHIYHSIQTPQGANISRGKWEGQIIFLGVNIYPYHPNSALISCSQMMTCKHRICCSRILFIDGRSHSNSHCAFLLCAAHWRKVSPTYSVLDQDRYSSMFGWCPCTETCHKPELVIQG
jgi:hypothetical protein